MKRKAKPKRRIWTAEEDAALRTWYPANGSGALTEALGRSADAIRVRAQVIGVGRRWPTLEERRVRIRSQRNAKRQADPAAARAAERADRESRLARGLCAYCNRERAERRGRCARCLKAEARRRWVAKYGAEPTDATCICGRWAIPGSEFCGLHPSGTLGHHMLRKQRQGGAA